MDIFLHFGKLVMGVVLLVLYCEVIIYYVVLLQCSWPVIEKKPSDYNFTSNHQPLKVMLIADPHLLGPIHGHWFDKLRREWQMYRTFQTAMGLHKPNIVFALGDLFDEGLWSNKKQFKLYVKRFHNIFHVPVDTHLYVVPGNHDMGFHYWIRQDLKNRFEDAFNTTSIEKIDIHGNIFVLINSMAMEGDGCFFCRSAINKLHNISVTLNNNKKENKYIAPIEKFQEYGRPVLLQHFPMYRKSDELCNEPDSAPVTEKQNIFREKWECLSQAASEKIFKLLNPRAIFTGHTHYGCHIVHKNKVHEWTLSSFSWRNHKSPSFILAVFTPDRHAVGKCYMPQEITVIWIYIVGGLLLLFWILFSNRKFVPMKICFIKYKHH